MPTAPMLYRELPATATHGLVIACYWEFAASQDLAPGHVHSIPVDGSVSLGYSRPLQDPARTVFVGPRIQAQLVPIAPGDRLWGVRFLPGTSTAAIGKSGSEWRDKIGLLQFELPDLATKIESALHEVRSLEEAIPILDGLFSPIEPCPITAAGVLAITMSSGNVKIADLPAQIGVSERQFQRRFRNEVGLTPKQYARICRFRSAAISALHSDDPNWGEIAADKGFSDQAHLTHEFHRLFGVTPSEFGSQFLTQIEHGLLHHS